MTVPYYGNIIFIPLCLVLTNIKILQPKTGVIYFYGTTMKTIMQKMPELEIFFNSREETQKISDYLRECGEKRIWTELKTPFFSLCLYTETFQQYFMVEK